MRKSLLKSLLPPAVRRLVRASIGWRWFRGEYATWAEARAVSTGYDADTVIERVLAATLKVRAGAAAFERDGVLFSEPVREEPLWAAMLQARHLLGRCLRVLDFGGALGSTYWRHRLWLGEVATLPWDVIEQPRFVAAGQQHLADAPLRFFSAVEAAEATGVHDLLLCSTTLQYLENPTAMLESWLKRRFPFVLLNNLPLHRHAPDRLVVQYVPPAIYPGSYPVWFFNRERMLARLAGCYDVIDEFASEAVWPVGWRQYRSTGLLLGLRTTP